METRKKKKNSASACPRRSAWSLDDEIKSVGEKKKGGRKGVGRPQLTYLPARCGSFFREKEEESEREKERKEETESTPTRSLPSV